MSYGNLLSLLNDLCRICLEKQGKRNIFNTQELAEDIETCTGVLISQGDNLPEKICSQCADNLKIAKQLRKTALTCDAKLQWIKEQDGVTNKTEDSKEEAVEAVVQLEIGESLMKLEDLQTENSKINRSSEVSPINGSKITVRSDLFEKEPQNHRKKSRLKYLENESYNEEEEHPQKVKHQKKSRLQDLENESNSDEEKHPQKVKIRNIKQQLDKEINVNECYNNTTCQICGKTFPKKKSLNLHLMLHNKSHPCPFCDKRFATKNDLRKHERVHTGEKPYQCDVCYKQFSQKGTLKCHKENVHARKSTIES